MSLKKPAQSLQIGKMRGIKISELIEKLGNAKLQHGDLYVMMSVSVQGDGGKTHNMVKPVWKGDIGLLSNGEKSLVLQPGGEFVAPEVKS